MKVTTLFFFLVCAQIIWAQNPNSWVQRVNFGGYKREQAVGFSIGNKGYIGTGVDTSETVLNDFWEFDPVADTWTQKADLPASGRRNAIGFGIGNKGYIGLGINSPEANLGNKLSDFWEYSPATNSWISKAAFPGAGGAGLYYATSFVLDSKGYVCGGKIGASSYVSELWEYKPSLDQWTQRQSFAGGIRYNLSSLTIDGAAYVGLGTDQDTYRNDWWKYSPATNSWTPAPTFIGGQRGGASTFTIGSKGYVCLGTNGGLKDDLWEFDPDAGTWSPRAYYGGSERKQAVAFAIGNSGFVGTGAGVSGKKRTIYEYIPLAALGTEELGTINTSCFPNPAVESMNFACNNASVKTVSLYNLEGEKLQTATSNENGWTCERNGLPAGSYLVLFQTENGTVIAQQTIQFVD